MEEKGSSIPEANAVKRRHWRGKWMVAVLLVLVVMAACWLLLTHREGRFVANYTGKQPTPTEMRSFGESMDTFAVTNFQSSRILVDSIQLQLFRNGQWQDDHNQYAITMWTPPNHSPVLAPGGSASGTTIWIDHRKNVQKVRIMVKYSQPKSGWAGILFGLQEAWRKKTFRALTADIFDGKQYQVVTDEWQP